MPLLNITPNEGLITDLESTNLPPGMLSDAMNVRYDGNVLRTYYSPDIEDYPGVIVMISSVVPTFIRYFRHLNVWVLGTNSFLQVLRSRSLANNPTQNATDAGRWSAVSFGQFVVINSARFGIFYFSSDGRIRQLSNNPTARGNFIREYKNFLILFNITESSINYNSRVRWSASSDTGQLPTTWSLTDTAKDAGQADIETSVGGAIHDAQLVQDKLYIYKDDSVWAMEYVGGVFVFRFYEVFPSVGILGPRCVVPIGENNEYFLVTKNDIVIHDGFKMQSIVENIVRKRVFSEISKEHFLNAFVVNISEDKDIWFCYPTQGNVFPNKALVYSFSTRRFSFRELPSISDIGCGRIIDREFVSFDSDSGKFDDARGVFDPESFLQLQETCLATYTALRKVRSIRSTATTLTHIQTPFVERTALALSADENGLPTVDWAQRKMYRSIWPRVQGGPVAIQTGTQEIPTEQVLWSEPKIFDPETDVKVDILQSGKALSWRLSSHLNSPWALESLGIEVEPLGRF